MKLLLSLRFQIARTILNRAVSPLARTQSRGMAGHNKQGIRAANEIYQESVKAFALVSFFTGFLDRDVISFYPHLSLDQHYAF